MLRCAAPPLPFASRAGRLHVSTSVHGPPVSREDCEVASGALYVKPRIRDRHYACRATLLLPRSGSTRWKRPMQCWRRSCGQAVRRLMLPRCEPPPLPPPPTPPTRHSYLVRMFSNFLS